MGFFKRLRYFEILFSEIHGIIFKKFQLKNLKKCDFVVLPNFQNFSSAR